MQNTIGIRTAFSTRDDAEDARERLEYGGFARNSMNIKRIADQFQLEIHTRPENRRRVQECIEASDTMSEAWRYGHHAPSHRQSALLVGVIAAIGAGLYYAYTRRRDLYAQIAPAFEPAGVQPLDEARREPANSPSTRPDCDLPENSQENLDKKLDHALKETFPTSDPVSVSITR